MCSSPYLIFGTGVCTGSSTGSYCKTSSSLESLLSKFRQKPSDDEMVNLCTVHAVLGVLDGAVSRQSADGQGKNGEAKGVKEKESREVVRNWGLCA